MGITSKIIIVVLVISVCVEGFFLYTGLGKQRNLDNTLQEEKKNNADLKNDLHNQKLKTDSLQTLSDSLYVDYNNINLDIAKSKIKKKYDSNRYIIKHAPIDDDIRSLSEWLP